ncbi:NUDIX hydrolase [Microbacterium sp. P05]|uniref:NUDIX hydrolase n=1 Tax=Microbacterium sp. P05 TaxID=3366948 RepID=UPI003746428C
MWAIRHVAVGLLVRNGKILVEEGADRVSGATYYRAPGGGIEVGETAEDAVRREFLEELGFTLSEVEPLGVLESSFTYEGESRHEITHVFAISAADPLPAATVEVRIRDTGAVVRWMAIESLGAGGPPLYPRGALDLLRR